MKYEEFIQLRQAGRISAGIDNSTAIKLIQYLPMRYWAPFTFWSWVWLLSIPAFICVAIFWKWWVGLLLLMFGTPAISAGTKQSAAQFVLDYAMEDADFFEKLVDNNLLKFKDLS
jgi:hypothetical protein